MSTRAAAKKRDGKAAEPVETSGGLGFLTSERFVLGSLLLLATLVVYFPVRHHPFVNYDDPVYVANNPYIVSGISGETISWAFTTFYQFNWHPITWISHAGDVQFFQLDPGGHHVTNMLIAAANVLLLFWVLQKATGYVGRSAMVAGLFALHPINVESVAWISERKNLLSMFFFLLGMGAYRWYAASSPAPPAASQAHARHVRPDSTPATGTPNVGRYALMTALFVFGLMSKPQIVTFPFLLLLWDYWPLRRMAATDSGLSAGTLTEPLLPARNFWWLVKEKIPLFVICAISAIITVLAQKAGGAVASLENYPVSVRITNAIVSYLRYIGKAFWPTNMAPLYPHPWHSLPLWQVLPALLAILAITALVIAARSHRYLLVGWFWFLGALVPMIGIVHVGNQAMADRYAYLPFIGLFLMLCWGVAELAVRQHIPVAALRFVSIVVLAALAWMTHRQLSYWSSNATLWTHTLEATNDNYIAHDNLALLLIDHGQTEEAMQHYHQALAIYPSDPSSNLAIAVYSHQHGQLPEAIARYDQMISTTPDGPGRAELFSNRGLVYLDMRDLATARQSFQRAVSIDPKNVRGWLGLGVVADRSGDLNAAIENYNRANQVKPLKITNLLLATALDKAGRSADAQQARQNAKLLAGDEKTTQTFSGGILGP